jgi:hypothetical protein
MKTRTRIAIGSVVAAAALTGGGVALAGHTNTIVGADLDGRSEVPASRSNGIAGDPNGSGEGYVFAIDDDKNGDEVLRDNGDTLCYLLKVEGIAELEQGPLKDVRMAHIHAGEAGENGPVVANLAWPQDGDAADCLQASEPGKFNGGSVEANQAIIDEILASPEAYYFNVHNSEYPGGAIRGQLHGHG